MLCTYVAVTLVVEDGVVVAVVVAGVATQVHTEPT
jgi:hypothetical protein